MWFEHSEIPMLYSQGTTEKGFKSSSGVDHAPCDNRNSLFGFKGRAIVQPSSAQAHGDGGAFRADENGKRHGNVKKVTFDPGSCIHVSDPKPTNLDNPCAKPWLASPLQID